MENTSVQRGLFLTFRLFPLIRPGLRPVHLPRRGRRPPGGGSLPSPGGRCRRSGGRGAVPGWFWVPPHTRRGYALPPSPRRGFFPHPSRLTACHLPRRGRLPPGGGPLPSPGGRCRRSGGRGAVPGWFWVPPHTRQGYALPPSPRRGFFPHPSRAAPGPPSP